MRQKHFWIFILIFISLFLLYSFNAGTLNANSPDEAVLNFFSGSYSQSGDLFLPSDENLPDHATLRGTTLFEGKIVPLKFIGFIIFFGGLTSLTPEIVFYLTVFSAILGFFFVYRFCGKLSWGNAKSLLCVGILGTLPFFWYWASQPFYENVAAVSFFMIGLYYFIETLEDKEKSFAPIIAGIFFGLGVAFRYDLALAVLSFVLVLVLLYKKPTLKQGLILAFVFLLFVSPSLIGSKILYGSFFDYGEKILLEENMVIQQRSLGNVLSYLKGVFFVIPSIFLLILSFFYKDRKKLGLYRSSLVSFVLYSVLFLFIVVARAPLKHPSILHESYTRYFLVFFVFLAIFLTDFIWRIDSRIVGAIFVSLLVIQSFAFTIPLLDSRWNNIQDGQSIAENILSKTPDGSLIIVHYSDKFIFPDRSVMPLPNFMVDGEVDYGMFLYELRQFEGDDLYLYLGDFGEEVPIFSELEAAGYELTLRDEALQLYKIENGI